MSKTAKRVSGKLLKLISKRARKEGTDKKSAIRDIMTELVHVCRAQGLAPEERFAAAVEVANEEDVEDELVECVGCNRRLPVEESYAPGDEPLCPACDTEVTGRVHKPASYNGSLGIECDTNDCDEHECHRCFPRTDCPHHAKCAEFTKSGEGYDDAQLRERAKDCTHCYGAGKVRRTDTAADDDQVVCRVCNGTGSEDVK